MEDSARTTHAHCRCAAIRELNDQLRTTCAGGRVLMSRGFSQLDLRIRAAALALMRGFTAFDEDNDPYREHDMGSLEINGTSILWKIDYYDKNLEYGSADPADPEITTRVLTIMLAEDY